jgi:hypothetical protein
VPLPESFQDFFDTLREARAPKRPDTLGGEILGSSSLTGFLRGTILCNFGDQMMRSEKLAARLAVFILVLSLTACVETVPTVDRGWLELGRLQDWRDTGEWMEAADAMLSDSDPKLLTTQAGTGLLVNGPTGKTVDLLSHHEHGDVEAHVDFMVPQGSNSGVYFQGRYEVQILDSWGVEEPKSSDCGGIYERWKDEKGYEGHPPRVNASRPPGEWQTFHVLFRAPRFDEQGNKTANARFIKVVHNGTVVHENVEVTGPTRAARYEDEKPLGPLMLQGDHGPVAFRNIRLRALD